MEAKRPEAVTGTYIFNRKNEILVVRSPKWHNEWIIPGGHIELGENILECAAREAEEETGLKVKPLGVLRVGEDIFPKRFINKRHFLYFQVICKTNGGKVVPNWEIGEYAWVKPSQALRMFKQPLPKKVVRDYIKAGMGKRLTFIDVNIN